MLLNHQQPWIRCRKKNKFGSCVPCESWKLQDDRTWKQGSSTKTTKLCFKHLVPRRNPNQNLSKNVQWPFRNQVWFPPKKNRSHFRISWSLFVFGYVWHHLPQQRTCFTEANFYHQGALLKSKPLDAKLVHTITSLPLPKSAKKNKTSNKMVLKSRHIFRLEPGNPWQISWLCFCDLV